MRAPVDYTGTRFGKLTVVSQGYTSRGMLVRVCLCDCGNTKETTLSQLQGGSTSSCGCLKFTANRQGRSPAYRTWSNMVARCTVATREDYPYYGGRGITVCDRWMCFMNFLADMGQPDVGMTLDRRNTNLGYFPENCTWATRKSQTRNRRITKRLVVEGVCKTVAEWSEITGVPYSSIITRMGKGLEGSQALYGEKYARGDVRY